MKKQPRMAICLSRRSDSFLILEGEAKRLIGEYQDSIRRTADFLVLATKSSNPLAVGVGSRGGIGGEPGPPGSNTGGAGTAPPFAAAFEPRRASAQFSSALIARRTCRGRFGGCGCRR